MEAVGVVLAGGRSTRMGTSKAGLDWHGTTLLRRVTGLVARGVRGPVLVVAAPGQGVRELAGVEVVRDPVPGRGPLQGLATGLSAAAALAEAAFVCATDQPFLHPRGVRWMVGQLQPGVDAVVPHADGRLQPLGAAYRTCLAARAAARLDAGEARLGALLAVSALAVVEEPALAVGAGLPPGAPSPLRNVNTPGEYARARALPTPLVAVRTGRAPAGAAGAPPRWVRAATLGAASAAVGVRLDAVTVVAVDGTDVPPDPEEPLAEGEHVVLRVAAPPSRGRQGGA